MLKQKNNQRKSRNIHTHTEEKNKTKQPNPKAKPVFEKNETDDKRSLHNLGNNNY